MRAAVFIDGGYFLKSLQEVKVTADYKRVANYFLNPLRENTDLDLLRCYFYYCAPWMSANPTDDEKRRMNEHEKFMAEIEALDRWETRLGKLEKRYEGGKEIFAQKRVDVQLSVDLVRHAAAGHVQHAVLVAGDSDFIPAVNAAKESGCTLTLWCAPDRSAHRDLIVAADEVKTMDWNQFPKAGGSGGTSRRSRSKTKSRSKKAAKEGPPKETPATEAPAIETPAAESPPAEAPAAEASAAEAPTKKKAKRKTSRRRRSSSKSQGPEPSQEAQSRESQPEEAGENLFSRGMAAITLTGKKRAHKKKSTSRRRRSSRSSEEDG